MENPIPMDDFGIPHHHMLKTQVELTTRTILLIQRWAPAFVNWAMFTHSTVERRGINQQKTFPQFTVNPIGVDEIHLVLMVTWTSLPIINSFLN